MKITRRTVDELNELAEKITGVNPGAKTDAQALNYIEQNYMKSAPVFVFDEYQAGEDRYEIDLTLAQFREIYRKTNGHFLIIINQGYGIYKIINQTSAVDDDPPGVLVDETSGYQLSAEDENDKFH